MCYINSRQELNSQIQQRGFVKEVINEKLDQWAFEKYGIEDFVAMSERFVRPNNCQPIGVLCRQIPSVFLEDVASYISSLVLGLKPVAYSFCGDFFNAVCSYKICLVKMPFSRWSKKGNLVLVRKKLTDLLNAELSCRVLRTIPTKDGLNLEEFHLKKRESVFNGQYPSIDISEFFCECLKRATERPKFVYQTNAWNKVDKKPLNKADLKSSRPPADWYYPLYLTLFMQSAVLFETYEGYVDDAPISKVFRSAINEIRDATGFAPMVVQILNFKDVGYCSEHLDEAVDFDAMAGDFMNFGDNSFDLFCQVSEQLKAFGRPI